jgi:selenide, water dikinase
MVTLNKTASEIAVRLRVHAMTDVTGFGLLGHLREMLGARLGAQIDSGRVALFPNVLQLAAHDVVPGGTRTNLAQARASGTRFDARLPLGLALVLCDAQTSGGLLMAVSPEKAQELRDALVTAGVAFAHEIGTLTATPGIDVQWRPPHA